MEPADFEKWCAGEMGYPVEYVVSLRKDNLGEYRHSGVTNRYRAYMAGVRSRLPRQAQPPEE